MNQIRLLIVDDEPLAHKVLQSYVDKIDYVEVIGNCYDGISTLNFLSEHAVDALLLDIEMPDLTGLELLDTLQDPALKVIFVTAHTEYALQGFDYDQVVDYLHKPVRLARFVKAVERLRKQLELERAYAGGPPKEPEAIAVAKDYLSLRDQKTVYKIQHDEIIYVQSWGNYLKFFLIDGRVKVIRATMRAMERQLPQGRFVRVHKSYIVNARRVRALEGNHIRLMDMEIPMGKSYAIEAKRRILGER